MAKYTVRIVVTVNAEDEDEASDIADWIVADLERDNDCSARVSGNPYEDSNEDEDGE